MKITTVFFDLDGTLLPQDQDVFIKTYFGALVKKLVPYGYEPQSFTKAMWAGIGAMMKNDGEMTNEKRFWQVFPSVIGEGVRSHYGVFEDFYERDFEREVKPSCGFNPEVKPSLDKVRRMGFRTVLATNPVFPSSATEQRIRWTGLCPEDFEYFTSYENSHYSKPNPEYYREILTKLGLDPCECVMVGNDVGDDMVAETLGMKVFLLTDNLINKVGADISRYPNGSFAELLFFLEKLN